MTENTNNSEIVESKGSWSLLHEVWEWTYTILIALVIVLLLKTFIFDIVRVDGPSMNPTLTHNDRLIVTKLGYTPKHGDIIILDSTHRERHSYYNVLAEESGKDSLNIFEMGYHYLTDMPKNLKSVYYVKRVIGLPGDEIDIRDGRVFLNGEILEEAYYDGYTTKTDLTVSYPVTVEEDCVFVMGDNRHNSKDSRASVLGQVPVDAVEGKAIFRLWPFSAIGKIK